MGEVAETLQVEPASQEKIIEKGNSDAPKCPKHGTIKQVHETTLFGVAKRFEFCDECSKEVEAETRRKEDAQKHARLQEDVNKKLSNSAIAARFKDKTLGNWLARTPAQKEVMAEVQAFLEAPASCTGLIFCGRPGTGKNHLACAVAKYFIINLHRSALVTTVFKMVRAIKETWRSDTGNEGRVVQSFVDVGLLVIDEVGIQFGSETEMLYLQEIINDRYEAERPTILISNKTPEEISEFLGERIIDRFRDGGHVLVFDWDSYRGRERP